MSNGRSFHYNESIFMVAASTLYSNQSNPMLTILEDSVGRHDFLYTPCSAEVFERNYGLKGHPNCLDNLTAALAPYDVTQSMITTPFNIFMNTETSGPGQEMVVRRPRSSPGDHVDLLATIDCLVGLTACAAEIFDCNGDECTAIEAEIL